MAASGVAAPLPPVNQQEITDGTMAAGETARAGPFEACVWGDFFTTYTPPPSQRSEEWMRERADQLMGEVRRKFEASKAMSVVDTLTLVDTLERLGIGFHFSKEIDLVLSRVHGEELDSKELHIVALRFRLLRQHGFWVSADVFDKFRDSNGSFSTSLCGKARDLLCLYDAAHMAVPSEAALDDAIAFARQHLEAVKGELMSPMAEQVSRALDIPRPRLMRPVEAMHYIVEYEQEETHDMVMLELARLEFNLLRSLHLKELRDLSLWWRHLYDEVKLSYSRDRIVEMYFWALGSFPWADNSRSRIIMTKVIGLTTLIDDTFDVHATFEECQRFNEAIQRWDESAVSILPEYLHVLYLKTLSHFAEFKDLLKPHQKYRVDPVVKAYKMNCELYLQEAKWSNENSMPTFKEQIDVSVMSSFLPTLCLVAMMGADDDLTTTEVFEWAVGMPDLYIASGEIARFRNDISSFKMGKNKKDVSSSIECYKRDHGVTGKEAAAALAAMVEHAWRRTNQACMEMDRSVLPAAQVVVDINRIMEVLYLGGRDAYTFGKDLKDIIVSLLLEPVAV